MDRRTPAATIPALVSSALNASGASFASLAQATDIHQSSLRGRLDTPSSLTFEDLVRVGGFLSFSPYDALGGVK